MVSWQAPFGVQSSQLTWNRKKHITFILDNVLAAKPISYNGRHLKLRPVLDEPFRDIDAFASTPPSSRLDIGIRASAEYQGEIEGVRS